MAKKFDPYATIPSRSVLQERLNAVMEEARRLRKLLKLASEIERERAQAQRREGGK